MLTLKLAVIWRCSPTGGVLPTQYENFPSKVMQNENDNDLDLRYFTTQTIDLSSQGRPLNCVLLGLGTSEKVWVPYIMHGCNNHMEINFCGVITNESREACLALGHMMSRCGGTILRADARHPLGLSWGRRKSTGALEQSRRCRGTREGKSWISSTLTLCSCVRSCYLRRSSFSSKS